MIRFAIAGTGRISDWILKGALQDPRFAAVAVCSRTEEAAISFIEAHSEAFSRTGGSPRVYTDIADCARDPEVDAVYIGTPSCTHYSYAMTCLNEGKAVLCEKPMACSEARMQEMVDTARAKGVLLMEAMVSTLNPNFIAARKAAEGIGPVRHCMFSYCQYSTRYDELLRGVVSNSFDPSMGGGALEDIGIYTVYPAVALFGEPRGITGKLQHVSTPKGPVDTGGSAILDFGDMTVQLSWSKAVDAHQCSEICGEKGNVTLDEIHICRHAALFPHAAPTAGRGARAEAMTLGSGLDHDTYYYEFKEFMDVLESGRRESTVNSLDVSLRCRRVMDNIHRIG